MQTISVIFVCGHAPMRVAATDRNRPCCPTCGEDRVSDVQAPRPRITFNGAMVPKETDYVAHG